MYFNKQMNALANAQFLHCLEPPGAHRLKDVISLVYLRAFSACFQPILTKHEEDAISLLKGCTDRLSFKNKVSSK